MRNLSRTRKSNRSQKKRVSKLRSSTRRRYSGGVWPFNLLFGKKQAVNVANTGIEMQTMKTASPLKNNSKKNNSKNNVVTKIFKGTIFSSNNSSRPSIVPAPNNGAKANNDPVSNLPQSPSAPSPSAPPFSPLPPIVQPNEPTDPTAIYGTTDPEALSHTPKPRRNRSNRSRRSNRSNRSNRRN